MKTLHFKGAALNSRLSRPDSKEESQCCIVTDVSSGLHAACCLSWQSAKNIDKAHCENEVGKNKETLDLDVRCFNIGAWRGGSWTAGKGAFVAACQRHHCGRVRQEATLSPVMQWRLHSFNLNV